MGFDEGQGEGRASPEEKKEVLTADFNGEESGGGGIGLKVRTCFIKRQRPSSLEEKKLSTRIKGRSFGRPGSTLKSINIQVRGGKNSPKEHMKKDTGRVQKRDASVNCGGGQASYSYRECKGKSRASRPSRRGRGPLIYEQRMTRQLKVALLQEGKKGTLSSLLWGKTADTRTAPRLGDSMYSLKSRKRRALVSRGEERGGTSRGEGERSGDGAPASGRMVRYSPSSLKGGE